MEIVQLEIENTSEVVLTLTGQELIEKQIKSDKIIVTPSEKGKTFKKMTIHNNLIVLIRLQSFPTVIDAVPIVGNSKVSCATERFIPDVQFQMGIVDIPSNYTEVEGFDCMFKLSDYTMEINPNKKCILTIFFNTNS